MQIPDDQLWFFFRFVGLEITDTHHDLSQPMFGDCTLLTKQQMRDEIIPAMNFNNSENDNAGDISFMMGCKQIDGPIPSDMLLPPQFDVHLAVRRGSALNVNRKKNNSEKDSASEKQSPNKEKDPVELAIERSYRVASLLTVWALAQSKEPRTCGLVDQVHRPVQWVTALHFGRGDFMLSPRSKHKQAISGRDAIKITRDELLAGLNTSVFQPLTTKIIADSGGKATKQIILATMQLADATLSSSSSFQALGAVTCIEMLLGASGISYDQATKRIISLLGPNAFEKYRGAAVLQLRHKYVHAGEQIPVGIAKSALALALDCLLTAASMIDQFKNKDELHAFLDFIDRAEFLRSHGTILSKDLGKFLPSYPEKQEPLFLTQFG